MFKPFTREDMCLLFSDETKDHPCVISDKEINDLIGQFVLVNIFNDEKGTVEYSYAMTGEEALKKIQVSDIDKRIVKVGDTKYINRNVFIFADAQVESNPPMTWKEYVNENFIEFKMIEKKIRSTLEKTNA